MYLTGLMASEEGAERQVAGRVGHPCTCAPGFRSGSGHGLRCEQRANALEIGRRVHADRLTGGFDALDPDPVRERAELFQRLGLLDAHRRQAGEAQQRVAAVDVHADVPPCRRRRAAFAGERNRRTGKVQREVRDRSTTTFVTFGLSSSDGSSIRLRSVLISSAGSDANGAIASSIISGSISGSSPWTLTIRSQSSEAATSASRSVPL